jgi:hypothetical protein
MIDPMMNDVVSSSSQARQKELAILRAVFHKEKAERGLMAICARRHPLTQAIANTFQAASRPHETAQNRPVSGYSYSLSSATFKRKKETSLLQF